MIFIGIDPGRDGGLAMVSDTGDILSVNRFQGGLPNLPVGFRLDKFGSHYEVWLEHADWKNAEIIKAKINLNSIYKAGFYVGIIHHDMYLRGANEVNLIAPRDWQGIFKGIPGKNTKEQALNYLKIRLNDPTGEYLKTIGAIGPKGGYRDGIGDAILVALWARDKWNLGRN